MKTKQAKLIISEGLVALKKDFVVYQSLRNKEKEGNQQLSLEEHNLKKRMWR